MAWGVLPTTTAARSAAEEGSVSGHIAVAVFQGHKLVGRRSFEGGIVTVGSAPGCALRFVGVAGVEHSHALVWDDGGVLTIVASAGATIALNGAEVAIARPGPDDLVSIGPLELRFELRDHAAGARAPEVEIDEEPTRIRPKPSDEPVGAQLLDESAELPARTDEEDDDEDDEEEPEEFLEPFSLLEQVTRSSGVAGGELTLQLVATRGGRLTELATIDRAAQYMPAVPTTLARHGLDGNAELSFGRGWTARVRARATGELVARPAGPGLLRFAVGGCAILQNGERALLAFFVRRPRLAPEIGRRGIAGAALRHGAAAAAVHLALGLVLVGLARPGAALSAGEEPSPTEDDTIDLYAYPDAPQQREPPPPVPVPSAAPIPDAHQAAATPVARRQPPAARPTDRGPSSAVAALPGTGFDDALADLERSTGTGVGSLREAIGAIDVAASSGGATPGYRVALPVSALGGPGLGGRRGGGGPLEVPLGGTEGVGRFDVPIPGGTSRVGGLVPDAGAGTGLEPTIDREAVQRVINQHQHEIVRCYERALLGSPGLAGTVRMGWTIAPGGTVAGVRIQRSTLGSSAVTSCISSAIRGWHFPSPHGGPVTVTFPWVLRPAGQQ